MSAPDNGLNFTAPSADAFLNDMSLYFDALNASRLPQDRLEGVTERHRNELTQNGYTEFRYDDNKTGTRSDVSGLMYQANDGQIPPTLVGDPEYRAQTVFCLSDWASSRQGVIDWFQGQGGTAPNGTVLQP